MTYILTVYLNETKVVKQHANITTFDDYINIELNDEDLIDEEVEDFAAQICEVGFYDHSSKTFYPPHRIHEIKIERL